MGSKQDLSRGISRVDHDLTGSLLFKPYLLPSFCTDFAQFVGSAPVFRT
jgi:hypothetical protein